jgi:5'-nucleotidase
MGRSFRGRKDASLEPIAYRVDGHEVRAFHAEGTPATVVRHALQVLCPERLPDLLVSGINYGENVGTSISASGTVGAAIEAASMGIPALAAARQVHPDGFMEHGEQDWRASEHFLRLFAERLLKEPMPFDVDMLKIDVPDSATPETPWRLSRLSRQRYFEVAMDSPGPESRIGDGRIVVGIDRATLEPDSDVHALAVERVVAVTPLSLDATSRTEFGELHRLLGGA